jgi:hypothetical protein
MLQYKLLPNTPSFDMLEGIGANIKPAVVSIYERMWKIAPDVEQEPYGYIYHNDYGLVFSKHHFTDTKNTELTAVYTHPKTQCEPLSNGYNDVLERFVVAGEKMRASGKLTEK